jgi:phosphopantetheine adenylyltransferase/dephospho-CoA kinase
MRSLFTIGLTGGIASGKSHIAADLERLGAASVDADKLGHEAYRRGTPTFDAIVARFGAAVVRADTGEIDRAALGQLVFADSAQMAALTAIVWPAIGHLLRARLDAAERAGAKIAVVEAAVLLEAGWQRHVDEVWVAWVPRDVAIERVMRRNALSRAAAEARLDAQWSNERRLPFAAVDINTDRPREQTQELVQMHFIAAQRRAKQSGK